jgi:hypothetical protein
LLRYYGNPERLRCLNTFGGNAGIVNCKRPHGKLLYYDPLELNMKRPTFLLFLYAVLCGRKPKALMMFTVFLWVEAKCCDVYSVYSSAACFRKVPLHKAERLLPSQLSTRVTYLHSRGTSWIRKKVNKSMIFLLVESAY